MPSKKKRGKVRRDEKAVERALDQLRDPAHGRCPHCILPENSLALDFKVCLNLIAEADSMYDEHIENAGSKICVMGLLQILEQLCRKYHDTVFLNAKRRDLCQSMLLSRGTKFAFIFEQNLSDDVEINGCTLCLCILYASLHKILHNHTSNDGIGSSLEIQVFALEAMQCPIEAVRFFHKHNSCECLKDLYHKVKGAIKRTARCMNCGERKDFREITKCSECNSIQYCSRGCQVSFMFHI